MPAPTHLRKTTGAMLLFAIAFCLQSCFGDSLPNSDQQNNVAMLNALRETLLNTSYAALIQQQKVTVTPLDDPDPQDDYNPSLHIYTARVLETFNGQHKNRISYRMRVTMEESTFIDPEPVIIALCEDKDGLYWPGTGSIFPANSVTIDLARSLKKPIEETGTDSFCE